MFAVFQQNYRIPQTNYRIIRFISQGTGGHVYVAEDIDQKIQFALKIQTSLQLQEYNALKHLNSNGPFEHVVNIQSLTTPNQFFQYYLIGMDLADGSFGTYWEQNAQGLDIKQILGFFLQITEGLEEIHKIGLIHRDMKLDNVVYCNQNDKIILKICDTGLMRDNQQDLRKTNMIGTPYYMPPEQINKNIYNEKVDIWSLGVILFEMITKTKMIDDPDTNGLLRRIINLTQNQIDLIILSKKQSIPIKIQELLKQMLKIDSKLRLSAQEIIIRVKSILFQDQRIQQVQWKPINMQQVEQEKRRREQLLQEQKQKELQDKLKVLDEESQIQKQQQINDFQNKQEAKKEQLLQEQKQKIQSNKNQEIKKLQKELQEKCDLIEQKSPNQQQYEIETKNMNDEYQRKIYQTEIQYSEQLKQYEIQIQNEISQQFEQKKEQIQEEIVQNIQNQVSIQYQQKFEQENILTHQIMKYKENYMDEFAKSQALAQVEINNFTTQQLQEQISQNQEKIKFVQNFVEQLKQYLQQIQEILNQLQKIQTKDDMEQFEKKKNEFANIQHRNLKNFIEVQKNSFQDIDHRQEMIIQEQMKQKLQSIAQDCNELFINIDKQIQDFIKQLNQYNLPEKYQQTLSNYQNQNTQFQYQIKQLNESQFQFTSEPQLNLLKQNLQYLQNNLNNYIKIIIKEIQDQINEVIQFLDQKINQFYQVIKQTTDKENFRNLYELFISKLNQKQSQENMAVQQLIQNLILISEFFNLNNYAIEYIQIFLKFQQFTQNKLNANLDIIIDDFTIIILNKVIKYMQNFTKNMSNKEFNSQFNKFLDTQFKKFFERLISEILQQFDNKKIKELFLFQKNYEDQDFKDFKTYIQNVEEEVSKTLQIVKEDFNKWDQEVKKFESFQSQDQINIQIIQQLQITKLNQQNRYNQFLNYINSTQQNKSLNQKYQSSAQNLINNIQFLQTLKNKILLLMDDLNNIIQNLYPQYQEKVYQWFNDLNQLQEIDVLDAEKQQLDTIFNLQCVHAFNYELFQLKCNLQRFSSYYLKVNQQQMNQSNINQKVTSLNNFINNIEKIEQQIILNQFILQKNQLNQYFRDLIQEKQNLIQAGVLNSFQQQKEDLDEDKITLQILIQTAQKIKNIMKEKIKQINLVKLRGKISSSQLKQLQLENDTLMRFGLFQILVLDHQF